MSNYREFRRRSLKRRMQQKILTGFVCLMSVVALGGVGWYGLSAAGILNARNTQEDEFDVSSKSEAELQAEQEELDALMDALEATATPQPVIITNQTSIATANEEDSNWNTVDYEIRVLSTELKTSEDGSTAMDFRLAGVEENGVVDLSYFDSVTFLGDSITQGFEVYETDITNVGATFCAYKNKSPKDIVNLSLIENTSGVEEVALDAIVESEPEQIYILLGTNVLTSDSDYSSFLAYYSLMIDMIYERLPDVTIYIQSITPVTASVVSEKPGLYASRLMAINDELAAIAVSKDCYFLNLWEVLADENGNFKSEYAAADGIHMNTTGYQAWIDYMRTHTVYTPDASYAAGTSYKIEA